MGRSALLRLEADLADAEEALTAAKPVRKVCDSCGQRIAWTPAQRAKVRKLADKVAKLRQQLRTARERG